MRVAPEDSDGLEALVRDLMRPPVSLARLRLLPGGRDVLHLSKGNGDDPGAASPERVDAPLPPPDIAAMRKRWADLLRRVYEVDPLTCPRCAGAMRVISFITQPAVIRRILEQLKRQRRPVTRPPPPRTRPVLATP